MSYRSILSKALILTLLLAGCGSEKKNEPTTETTGASNPQDVLEDVSELATLDPSRARPSAMLGFFVVRFISERDARLIQTSVRGVGSLMLLVKDEQLNLDETFQMLQELGSVLQVDVAEMLNQSTNRAEALNVYIQSLQNIGDQSTAKVEELESLADSHRTRQREQQKVVTDIDREINKALRDKDYATAGSLQPSLIDEQKKLAEIEGELDRTRQILNVFKDLLKIAEQRLNAIEQNKEILIAGLKVIELPGVKELKILEDINRRDIPSPFGEI